MSLGSPRVSVSRSQLAPPPLPSPTDQSESVTADVGQADASAQPEGSSTLFWAAIGGGALLVVALLSFYLYLSHPRWEDTHRAEIESIKTSADTLLAQGKPEDSYYEYQKLIKLVSDRPIQSESMRMELDRAKASMNVAYQQAAPLIEAERQKELALEQAEQQRHAAEVDAAQQAEAERKQREAAQAALATAERLASLERARRKADRLFFVHSDLYTKLNAKADGIVDDLNTSLIGEDSAYRGMSKRSAAARKLLTVYVKAEGHLASVKVVSEVDRIESSADVVVAGEDSAIRAVYENDSAFFEELGPLCSTLAGSHPDVKTRFDSEKSRTRLRVDNDDSAPRAAEAFTSSAMQVLESIADARGLGSGAASIVSNVTVANAAEDSAWRALMRDQEGCARLLSLMISQEDPSASAKIDADLSINLAGENSAYRAIESGQQGTIAALRWLIQHP